MRRIDLSDGMSAAAVFSGSFLLFMIQPMLGRTLLPAFGGSAAVWSVCLGAYQVLLLAGYAYAHLLAGKGVRTQRVAHLSLLGGAVVWAVAFAALQQTLKGYVGASSVPSLEVLFCVLVFVGLPYVLLAAGSSMVQAWVAGAGAPRVIPLMMKYFHHQLEEMPKKPLKQWAIYRWQDEVVSIVWLYNRTGDAKLLELARMLAKDGYNWRGQFENFPPVFQGKTVKPDTNLKSHVVNNAMALKTSPVWWLVSGDAADRSAVYTHFRVLDQYHLLPNGAHSGDEHYAGLDASQGSELCSIVEAVYSLVHVVAAIGDTAFADRQEKLAYNPMPGTFSGDMWSHQYDQQPNQVLVDVNRRNWTTNGQDSNLFGLEPNFGCCLANMHQGWPKFAANLWMATHDQGLAAVAYGPSEVTAPVRGGEVTITEDTEYPFREQIRFAVRPSKKLRFPISFRVPGWADAASLKVNGRAVAQVKAGTFHRVEREWAPGDKVELVLPMKLRVTRWNRNAIAVERGPLVYSLKIGEEWRKLRDKAPAADWEVRPTTPWNYALAVDEKRPEASIEVVEKPLGRMPFSPEGAPVELRVKGRKVPEWVLEKGSAGPVPLSPVASAEPEETLTLIPYGSAKLRVTAFPQLGK